MPSCSSRATHKPGSEVPDHRPVLSNSSKNMDTIEVGMMYPTFCLQHAVDDAT